MIAAVAYYVRDRADRNCGEDVDHRMLLDKDGGYCCKREFDSFAEILAMEGRKHHGKRSDHVY